MFILSLALLSCISSGPKSASGLPIKEYRVDFGDSLWVLAERFAVPGGYTALARLNNIPNPAFIEAGRRLKVPTQSDKLPDWPRIVPAVQPLTACAIQSIPIPATRGGEATFSAGLAPGLSVTASTVGGVSSLALTTYGPKLAWKHQIRNEPSDWLDPESALVPMADPHQLLAFYAQLDADPGREMLLGWKIEENNLGMSRWQVAVLDDRANGQPTTFQAANFGPGSIVQGDGGCDVLATEWTMGSQPGETQEGWNLVARRLRLHEGDLRVVPEAGLLSRRLYDRFHPARVSLGNVVAGAVNVDFASPATGIRSIEPAIELLVLDRESARVHAWGHDSEAMIDLGSGLERISDTMGVSLRRLGDRDSGLLYPVDFTPADFARWSGIGAVRTTYQAPWWGEAWAVAWLAS